MQNTVKKVSMYVQLSVCTYVQFPNLPLQTFSGKTTADITLGVKSKLDNFTPKVTAAVVFSTKGIPLKTT